jgi:glycosyltransferase involved in cell wall biosynthesis
VTRVLYVQYSSPYAFPPLMRGAQLLADAGADVRMLGVGLPGTSALELPEYPGVDVRMMSDMPTGWRLKAHYARYAAWVTREASRWQPDWIYASDLFATPLAALFVRQGRARIVYHEHDAPSTEHESWAVTQCLTARTFVARHADMVVVPNEERGRLLSSLGGGRVVHTVWNCPRRRTFRSAARKSDGPLAVVFRGSINAERLPMTIIDAIARVPGATLDVIGYETVGSRGYMAAVNEAASRLDVSNRVRTHGALPDVEAAALCARADVGLALMPMQSGDLNMRTMPGASNKLFEYLESGVAPLVSDLPDWRSTFVDGGYAIACDPSNVDSIVSTLALAAENRAEVRAIAARGQARLLTDWNYETQFAPVLDHMLGERSGPSARPGAAVEAECAS